MHLPVELISLTETALKVCLRFATVAKFFSTKPESQLPALLGGRRLSDSADPGAAGGALPRLPLAQLFRPLTSLLLWTGRVDLRVV